MADLTLILIFVLLGAILTCGMGEKYICKSTEENTCDNSNNAGS